MALFMFTNQHQPEDCPELADELSSHYETRKPAGGVNVWCNCGAGDHKMFSLVEAIEHVEAMQAVPARALRSATTVREVEEAYKFATVAG